jgi:hypothetical protein
MKFKDWNDSLNSSSWLDPAYGGICTTGQSFEQLQSNDIIIKGYVYPKHVLDVKKELSENLINNKCIDAMYEKNGLDYKRENEIKSISPFMRGVQSLDNKNYRIMFYTKKFMDRLYFADDCQVEYLEQLRNWEDGAVPNEAPDTLASLLREKYDRSANNNNNYGVEIEENNFRH